MAAETPTVWTFGTLGRSGSCLTVLLTASQWRVDWWMALGGMGAPLRAGRYLGQCVEME